MLQPRLLCVAGRFLPLLLQFISVFLVNAVLKKIGFSANSEAALFHLGSLILFLHLFGDVEIHD